MLLECLISLFKWPSRWAESRLPLFTSCPTFRFLNCPPPPTSERGGKKRRAQITQDAPRRGLCLTSFAVMSESGRGGGYASVNLVQWGDSPAADWLRPQQRRSTSLRLASSKLVPHSRKWREKKIITKQGQSFNLSNSLPHFSLLVEFFFFFFVGQKAI